MGQAKRCRAWSERCLDTGSAVCFHISSCQVSWMRRPRIVRRGSVGGVRGDVPACGGRWFRRSRGRGQGRRVGVLTYMATPAFHTGVDRPTGTADVTQSIQNKSTYNRSHQAPQPGTMCACTMTLRTGPLRLHGRRSGVTLSSGFMTRLCTGIGLSGIQRGGVSWQLSPFRALLLPSPALCRRGWTRLWPSS